MDETWSNIETCRKLELFLGSAVEIILNWSQGKNKKNYSNIGFPGLFHLLAVGQIPWQQPLELRSAVFQTNHAKSSVMI